jgi:hypothetical protein
MCLVKLGLALAQPTLAPADGLAGLRAANAHEVVE